MATEIASSEYSSGASQGPPHGEAFSGCYKHPNLAIPRCKSAKKKKIYPKDPSVLKIVRRANLLRRDNFGTEVAKRYGECSEVLVFLGKRGRETVRIVKNYGGSKTLRIRAPCYF